MLPRSFRESASAEFQDLIPIVLLARRIDPAQDHPSSRMVLHGPSPKRFVAPEGDLEAAERAVASRPDAFSWDADSLIEHRTSPCRFLQTVKLPATKQSDCPRREIGNT